jgi:DNA polymerase-3 subunit gamma/tau
MNETANTAYRVLARKYRPETFSTLIGQDALVRTLSNALSLGRLAHAFVLTGCTRRWQNLDRTASCQRS